MGQYDDGGYGAWIPGPVLDDPGLRPRSTILYAKIARRANRVGFCYATNATLIDDMTAVDDDGSMRVLSERTIQAMLAELQERGHIRVDTGPLPPSKSGTVRTGRRIYIGRSLASIPDASEGGEENFNPEKNFTQWVKKSSPPIKGIKEIKKNIPPIIPQGVMDVIAAYAGEDEELRTALYDFCVNRATPPKACPVKTAVGMKRLLSDLDKCCNGDRALKLESIGESITHNWRGLFGPYSSGRRSESDRSDGYSREVNGWEV